METRENIAVVDELGVLFTDIMIYVEQPNLHNHLGGGHFGGKGAI